MKNYFKTAVSSLAIAALIAVPQMVLAQTTQPVSTTTPIIATTNATNAAGALIVAPLETTAKEAIVIDANTNTVLFVKDADTKMAPSSMTKMLTIYLVFEALKDGRLKMDQQLPVSKHAWQQEGSRMYLNVGQTAAVEDLIRGDVIQSGNDASVVFAEALGGSEEGFSEMMNAKAVQLGMSSSHFVNATGLPDPEHYSTARDLSTIGLALLRDFPQYYHYFSETSFKYNNIEQGNRNPLLYRAMNVDGIKTGHTNSGGFGITVSALRNDRRLVVVINGTGSMQARADESAKLLDWGYREFGYYPVVKAGDIVGEAKVWLGMKPTVELAASEDFAVTLPRSARNGLKTLVTYNQPIEAPIAKGQVIGTLSITAPGIDVKSIPLVAAADVPRMGFFARMGVKMHSLFHKA